MKKNKAVIRDHNLISFTRNLYVIDYINIIIQIINNNRKMVILTLFTEEHISYNF